MITDYIRSDILAQSAYHIADLPDNFIKLDAMEMPYRFPAELQNELALQLADAPVNRYPNPARSGLSQLLRTTFSLPENAAIALGNGSDELIQFISLLVAKPNATILAIEPSFVMYKRNAQLFGLNYVGVALNDDFSLNTPAVLDAIAAHNPALIFIAYPNNPTGAPYSREDVETIIQAASGIVVIDEAYGAFSNDSFIGENALPENVVVVRTLSKIGFAGLRLGYAVGNPLIINELNKILPPYNMNQLSLIAAKFALQHIEIIHQNIELLKAEREHMTYELTLLEDVTVFPSQANFLTVRFPNADYTFNTLKQNRILVKNLNGVHPVLNECLRLTIGAPDENAQVLRVVRNVIEEHVAAKNRHKLADLGDVAKLNRLMAQGVLIAVAAFSLLSIVLVCNYFSYLAATGAM